MATFYRGPDVLITDKVFFVRGPCSMRFEIAELRRAHVVITRACFRLIRRTHELRATYGGSEVSLFQTTDARVFGQVRRGLLRALERRGCRPELWDE